MSCDKCREINIPDRLCSDGKPFPLPFEDEEQIFRRHPEIGNIDTLKSLSESQIGKDIFKLEQDSYNRSTLSHLDDVLLNDRPNEIKGENYYKSWGIISIYVDVVNEFKKEIIHENVTKMCTLKVVHTANPCNYAHSEIYCYLDNVKHNGKAPKSVLPLFRRELQKIMEVEKERGYQD
jgi:hypothetical protein